MPDTDKSEPIKPSEQHTLSERADSIPPAVERAVGDDASSASEDVQNLLALSKEQLAIREIYAELARNPEPGKEKEWKPINLMELIASMSAIRDGMPEMTEDIAKELETLKAAILAKPFVDKLGIVIETNEKMREIVGALLDAIQHLDPNFKNGGRIRATSQMAKAVWEGYTNYIPRSGEQAERFREDTGKKGLASRMKLQEIADTVKNLVEDLGKSSQERREVKKGSSANEQSNTLLNFERTPSAQAALEVHRKNLENMFKTKRALTAETGKFDREDFDASLSRLEADFIAAMKMIVQEIIPDDYDYTNPNAPQNKVPDAQKDEINTIMNASFGPRWR